jgi:3-hydroxyacyl-[acyl-carrier-protein] dehydratase
MLLNELFVVEDRKAGDGMLSASLRIRFPHPIFDGHFPGRPVLPGACLVQLVEELASAVAGREVRLIRAGQIKFISMVDPLRDATIAMTLQLGADGQITAEGANASAVCFRFKGVFRAGSDYVG